MLIGERKLGADQLLAALTERSVVVVGQLADQQGVAIEDVEAAVDVTLDPGCQLVELHIHLTITGVRHDQAGRLAAAFQAHLPWCGAPEVPLPRASVTFTAR